MQRSRLKNIANKSKEMMKPVVGEFEQFKNSLPIEIDDNYRLEAAWKAYGKPKNYQEALWEGLVQPIDDKTFKMPSIGYNEETEEYEYLNKGKENETVNRDIRVWDNDVIPFVKELKHGGYIRVYNDEKDCWTYKKGGKIKVQMADGSGTIEIDYPDEDQKAGRKPIGEKDGKKLYLNGDGKAGYADPKEGPEQTRWMKEGGKNSLAEIFKNGGKPKKEKNDSTYAEFIATLPPNLQKKNDGENGYRMRYAFDNSPNVWTFDDAKGLFIDWNDEDKSWHGTSVFGPTGEFLKSSTHPTVHYEIDWYNSNLPEAVEFRKNNELVTTDENGKPLKYYRYVPRKAQAFKQGGQMNVIPEGALHARKNNMEGAGEDFTHKGIPVVDNDGEQQAEIERNEVIFNKDLTDFIESNYKKFKSEETKNSEKDEIAIKVGKRLVKELLTNTDDRTGLISEVEQKM